VIVWGIRDHLARKHRTDWSRPLVVGIVLVQLGDLDADLVTSLKKRIPTLTERLDSELLRYRPTSAQPIELLTFGPVAMSEGPPQLLEDGVLALTKHNYAVWRYVSAVDERAAIDGDGLDARIYVVLRAPEQPTLSFVEGASQEGGWVGLVDVELNEGMVDFTLFVVAHEMFHTFGATDKYDENGTIVPDGLADIRRQLPVADNKTKKTGTAVT